MTLNLETTNQSSCMTLWPTVLHHHTKFGYRRFSSWGNIIQMNIHWNSEPSPLPWPWPQQSNPIFSEDNSRRSAAEEILSRWTFTGILNLFCDLDLDYNRAIQPFHKTIHLMMMWHQNKFSRKRISSSDNISKRHILIILSITVTLTLKTANQSFWQTIWLMMVHPNPKFGSKWFGISEAII